MNSEENPTLGDLLDGARKEDAHCLNRLFAECRNYLQLSARAQLETWLRSKVDASDLVQQTLLEAYRDFPNFRGTTEAEWLVWLRRILQHNLANFLRQYQGTAKRQVSKEVALAPSGASHLPHQVSAVADSGETPSRYLLRKERELLLADALAQLSPDYQEVILLRNLERLPFQEVAERMGRSRPAVQMLWMRAVEQLKDVLAQMKMSLSR